MSGCVLAPTKEGINKDDGRDDALFSGCAVRGDKLLILLNENKFRGLEKPNDFPNTIFRTRQVRPRLAR
jgi:hypothetical protein